MNSEQAHNLHEALLEEQVIRSCLNCDNFKEEDERCILAPAYPLPAKVIVFGCPKWTGVVPF